VQKEHGIKLDINECITIPGWCTLLVNIMQNAVDVYGDAKLGSLYIVLVVSLDYRQSYESITISCVNLFQGIERTMWFQAL
jgi:hypothetical protein